MKENSKTRIAELTREVMEKQHELNELMRNSMREPIQDYQLQASDGPVQLSELFGDHRDMVLIHNMGKSCPYCTLWADGFNGVVQHFENRAAFVVVSPNSPAVQQEFAKSRDWNMRMISSEGSSFTKDLGFESERGVMPGFSTLRLHEGGSIERIAFAFFGPGDSYSAIWNMIGVLQDGVADWQPKYDYP